MKKMLIFAIILACAMKNISLAQLTPKQHTRLVAAARWLGQHHLRYCQDWTPPGESREWEMDCSNTARYLYRIALGKELPRTASDQYYTLKQKNLVTDAPLTENGDVDTAKLLGMLRSGDLLFWEWTYNIKRTPPVSHVMIYLGQTKNGVPKMTGSSSRTNGGGVHIFNFDPNAPSGGVKNFFGNYIRKGRFVGFGRPFAAPDTPILASNKKTQDTVNE